MPFLIVYSVTMGLLMEAMAVDHYIDVVHSIHVILLLFCIHMYIYHIALYVYGHLSCIDLYIWTLILWTCTCIFVYLDDHYLSVYRVILCVFIAIYM